MRHYRSAAAVLAVALAANVWAQPDGPPKQKRESPDPENKIFIFGGQDGPRGGGPGGFGGPGGPMGGDIKLVARFDKNGDGRLDKAERKEALEALKKERGNRRGGFGGGFGPPGGFPGGPPGDGPGGFLLPFPPPGMEDEGPPDAKDKKGEPRKGEKAQGDEKGFGPMKGGRGRGFGFPGMEKRDPPKPGEKISPSDVKPAGSAGLYDLDTVRTLFLDFESDDWQQELTDFHGTDVEIPATLTVDGKKYSGVGVHFRGMSSYMMVPAGFKRSMNVSVDFTDSKQRLMGRKTLNLLNSHEDPSHMGTVLYSTIADKYVPTPKANFVRVVVNGENWGVYTNVEQFDKDFVEEHFKSSKKAHRWKVRGSPMGRGGLEYLGDSPDAYRNIFEIKGGDDARAWPKLIKLCKTLNETPLDQLEEKLKPMLDIDGALKFLAVENALVNCDGYWIRASDYSIVCDSKGVFHIIPHDMNEAFRAPMGPGMGPGPGMFGGGKGPGDKGGADKGGPEKGGPGRRGMMFGGGGGSPDLDPLRGLDDAKKPLRSRLLAVPSLRDRYLEYVKQIAREDLDVKSFLPLVARCRKLIEKEVAKDTKKLSSIEDFQWATGASKSKPKAGGFGMPTMTLKEFAEQRRKYLLAYKPTSPSKESKTEKGAE